MNNENKSHCMVIIRKAYYYNVIIMLEILIDNIFVQIGRTHCSTNHRHPIGNKMCPSPCRSLSLLLGGRVYAKNLSKTSLYVTSGYIDDVLSINNPNFAEWIPLIYLRNNRNSFLCPISLHLSQI